MMTNDGHRLIGVGTKNAKMIQCTRWSELTSSLKFHAQLAHAAKAPTEFRLLNNCEPILVGTAADKDGTALQTALTVSIFDSKALLISPYRLVSFVTYDATYRYSMKNPPLARLPSAITSAR